MEKKFQVNPVVAVVMVVMALAVFSSAKGAVKTWSGGGANANWQTAGNWVGGVAPTPPSDSLVFTGSICPNNTNDWASGKIFQGITFDAGASAFTLSSVSGGTVTLSGYGITNNSPNLQVINCPLRANSAVNLNASSDGLILGGAIGTSSGTGMLNIQGAHDIVIMGIISITGGVTVQNTGPGKLTLAGANTYGGDTTLDSGTLKLGASEVIPDGALAGNVRFNPVSGTATLDVAGRTETINGLSSSGLGSSIVDNSTGDGVLSVGADDATSSFSGVIRNTAGTLAVTKIGNGVLTLNGANTYVGGTTIGAGTLALGVSASLSANSTVSIAAGATLDVSAQNNYTLGASASLIASGAGTNIGTDAAFINGGDLINLGARPVVLNFAPTVFAGDFAHPALCVSGGLTLSGPVSITNNGALPLAAGNYLLISLANGNIAGTPTLAGVFGQGLAGAASANLLVTNGNVILVVISTGNLPDTLTLTRHAGTSSSTTYGDAVAFDVSISPPEAPGMITLRDDNGFMLGAAVLTNGTCTISPALNALIAGAHTNLVAIYSGGGNYAPTNSTSLSPQLVAQKTLSVAGAIANSRLYNGTTSATISGALTGIVSGDSVTLNGTGVFASAGPGTNIAVTSTSTIAGADAANYTLVQPVGLQANIAAAPPNVLLIMGDQWRGCGLSFGPNHDADVRTPSLQKLASQGVRFDRCYATYPLCTPNRATLITGRYPTQTGMMDNDLMLPPDIPCMADVFTDAGYATYYCGKYHIDGGASPGYVPKSPNNWRRRGYTTFEGFNRGHNYFETSDIYNDDGQLISVPTNNPGGTTFDEKYLANYEPHRETDLAMAFIRTNANKPWLVHLSWGPPHSPYTPPPVFDTYVAANLTARPNNPARQGMSSLAGSYGSREALDYEVGRLMQLLDDFGLSSRTLVIFTSDHGDMLGSHGLSDKNKPEDESLRVPLIMRWTGKIPAGQTNDFLIATMDLMPTTLKLAGLEIPADTTGKDKSAVILGTNMTESPVFSLSKDQAWRAVVKRTDGKLYKLVMENVPPFQPTKFWNITDDPYELNNLTNQPAYAAIQVDLQQEILNWQQVVGDPWPAQAPTQAVSSYSFIPSNVQPVTVQFQKQADGSWLARVPSQSRVTFNMLESPTLENPAWTNFGPPKSGNGNMLNFLLPVDPARPTDYFKILQSW